MPYAGLLPVRLEKNGTRTRILREEAQNLTMRALGLSEADIEEFIRLNLAVLFPYEEENLLIVGQQVRNLEAGRADLVAVDGNGSMVLIELKRDADDSGRRKEAFE